MSAKASYLALVPVLLIAAYSAFGHASSRESVFAMLTLTWIGAWELALLLRALLAGIRAPRVLIAHGLVAFGGLVTGFAVLRDMQPFLFSLGCLGFAAGVLLQPAPVAPGK